MSRFWEGHETDDDVYGFVDSDYDDDEGDEESLPSKPHWLRLASRPIEGDDPASAPHPETVLLDTLAYIDGKRNATTAAAARTNGHPIQVTFNIACPPRLSHLAVHCPDGFPTPPLVVSTDDDLALLRVPVYPEHRHDRRSEFFVYRAGTGDRTPILHMIPDPSTIYYADKDVGVLSCQTDDNDRFLIAVLNQDLSRSTPERYIHLFDSESSAWITKQVYLKSPKTCSHASTSKVITIGGKRGSMGWVDLCHGIIVYDVLPGNDKVRYIPLPSPGRRQSALELEGLPGAVRDITIVHGVIKYFAMYTNAIGEWRADAWKMKQPWKEWRREFHLKASEITVDDERRSEILRDLAVDNDAEGKNQVLTRLRAGSPVLSLQGDDVVYILTKPMNQENKAWVVAVDMNTKTVPGVDEFDAGRTFGLTFT